MASSSGTSSSSSLLQNSGSEEDLMARMDQRKRKRMISNRESARRSRMRKQKHLDDLTAQMGELEKENHQIVTSVNLTSQHYINIEAENSVLRAQVDELTNRLQSLHEIVSFLNTTTNGVHVHPPGHYPTSFDNQPNDNTFFNPLNLSYLNHPIMASAAQMFPY